MMSSTRTDSLLEGLTEPQAQAVTHADGPLLVLAGPGSGKTRVITRRAAHLVLRTGIPPWNVLCITFTNKAAGEMRDRVAQLVSERQARAMTLCTFHALCARLLRQYAERLGLPPGYSIYDTADQQRLIKEALSDLEINAKNFPPSAMLAAISNAKNELVGVEQFHANASNFYDRTVAKVYVKYQAMLERNHALDFDDLLFKTVLLMQKDSQALAELRERYQYVMIDEYQDTNHAQFMIANALAAEHKNICATGDPDQSIYGWRGANIRNILEFESHYPNAVTVRLEQNYRSTKKILAAADALIRHNSARKHKDLFTFNDDGEPVQVVQCNDERHEAAWVTQQFQKLHDEQGLPWSDMAVFYRINSLSRVMEDTLRNAGVPYQIARGTAFYDRKEIKDAVAYLRVIANPADEVNLQRIINTPARGISDKTVKAMQAFALANHTPFDQLLDHPALVTALNARAEASVARFGKMVRNWQAELTPPASQETTLRGLVETVLRDSGLETYYGNDKSDPDGERLANLGELVTSAQQFEEEFVFENEVEGDGHTPDLQERLFAFLERIALVADVDGVDNSQGSVTLMTLHAAKGLEYPAVAMIGVEDGLLPHDRANKDANELEEERRLCFVGITRAEKSLFLSHARYRTVFGQTQPTIPSRFFKELPRQGGVIAFVDADEEDALFGDDYDPAVNTQRTLAKKQAGQYPPGTLVRHPQFGLGRIVTVNPMGAHTRAKINFNTTGPKTLILQYARLERVGPAGGDAIDDAGDLPF